LGGALVDSATQRSGGAEANSASISSTVGKLERELQLLLAIKLFELKRVSMGQAADIAGLSRFAFRDELAKLGVAAIDFDPEEAEQEFGNV
jgi:predicted HTH domain antitoxin